jgi:NADH dehydrogenase
VYLRATGFENVFVIGDCAAVALEHGKWVPPRAQSAHQMAKNAADNIIATFSGRALKGFKYVDYGSLVNLARFTTVGNLMGNLGSGRFFVQGLFARIMYISLYRMHQTAIHGIPRTVLLWVVHKLNRYAQPKLKLH